MVAFFNKSFFKFDKHITLDEFVVQKNLLIFPLIFPQIFCGLKVYIWRKSLLSTYHMAEKIDKKVFKLTSDFLASNWYEGFQGNLWFSSFYLIVILVLSLLRKECFD